jgi:hypothetical protein
MPCRTSQPLVGSASYVFQLLSPRGVEHARHIETRCDATVCHKFGPREAEVGNVDC